MLRLLFSLFFLAGSVLLKSLDLPLRVAGPIFFIALQGSSIITARKIIRLKTVGQLSSFPFISLLTNCFIWTLYGYLKADKTVFYPNLSGAVVAVFCICAFHYHAATKPRGLYALAGTLILLSILFAITGNAQLIGWMGCLLSIILSGSPLAVLRTVIAEKSTAAMPFATSCIVFFSNLSWLCYGSLIANDPLIYGPGVLGFLLSCAQMVLFVLYGLPATGSGKGKKSSESINSHELAGRV